MGNSDNVRQYDLFKLIVTILLFVIFLFLFIGTRNSGTVVSQSDSTILPTLTPVSTTQVPTLPTNTSSPIPSPSATQASEPTTTPTDIPVSTPTASATPDVSSADGETSAEISTCEEIAKSQLKIGTTAVINQRLNFRSSPSIQNNRILTHKPNSRVDVIGGPTCTRYENGGAYLWWQLKHENGLVGWSAEASIFGDYYFMKPAE